MIVMSPNSVRLATLTGRRLAGVGGAPLRKLLDLLAKAKAFVEPCCNPGEHAVLSSFPQAEQALKDRLKPTL